jgi:hypothetical protein
MIYKSFQNTVTTVISFAIVTALAASCSSSDSTSTTTGTTFDLSAFVAPAVPSNVTTPNPGEKQFTTQSGDTVTLTKAYLVIASVEIVTSCTVHSQWLDSIVDTLIPPALAHTTPTPTTTGVPYVIDLMATDGTEFTLGQLAPPPGDYCGADIFMDPADSDTFNLPGDVPGGMIGKTLYLEGSYVRAGETAPNDITVSIDQPIEERNLLLPAVVSVSASNLNGSASTSINYDTWFNNSVVLDDLASGDPGSIQTFMINVTFSLAQ